MQEGAGAEGGIQLLLTILADGEEQARQLGELADDPRSRAEHYRGAAARLQCTLGKAMVIAKAVEATSASSRGTDRSDSPRSADESSGATVAVVEAQERQGLCKRRCVHFKLENAIAHRRRDIRPYVRMEPNEVPHLYDETECGTDRQKLEKPSKFNESILRNFTNFEVLCPH